MQAIKPLLFILLQIFSQSASPLPLSSKELALLTRDLHIPKTWRISEKMKPVRKKYPNSYCTAFHSRKTEMWLGEICLSSNKEFISAMGFRDEVPDEERWGDREELQIGYFTITPLFTYPMTPFILKPIKNYAAESDCYLDDGPVYRATSMCHTALYELREGVYIYSVFHLFDNVKRKQKVQVSDIRNLWIQLGNRIRKESER